MQTSFKKIVCLHQHVLSKICQHFWKSVPVSKTLDKGEIKHDEKGFCMQKEEMQKK